jgi:FixJ family two-component response regulator
MTNRQSEAEALVVVVDDDASVRQALTSLLQSVNLHVEAFGSTADFFEEEAPSE